MSIRAKIVLVDDGVPVAFIGDLNPFPGASRPGDHPVEFNAILLAIAARRVPPGVSAV